MWTLKAGGAGGLSSLSGPPGRGPSAPGSGADEPFRPSPLAPTGSEVRSLLVSQPSRSTAPHFPCSRDQRLPGSASDAVPSADVYLQEGTGPGRGRGWPRVPSRSWLSWTKPRLLVLSQALPTCKAEPRAFAGNKSAPKPLGLHLCTGDLAALRLTQQVPGTTQ